VSEERRAVSSTQDMIVVLHYVLEGRHAVSPAQGMIVVLHTLCVRGKTCGFFFVRWWKRHLL